MDAERQPLLQRARLRYTRPLTIEEVQRSRTQRPWRSAQCAIIVMFWVTMAMFLSLIVCIIMSSTCSIVNRAPAVPPVHMTFAPLMSRTMQL